MSLKVFYKSILIIIASIVLGFMLLSLAYCIPTRLMVDAGYASSDLLALEGDYPYEYFSFKTLDNFTDSVMLNIASYSGDESFLKKVILSNYYSLTHSGSDNSASAVESFQNLQYSGKENMEVKDYSRYWHGYLLLLKPLYALFDYQQIREINRTIQYVLLLVVFLLIYKKEKACLFPFAIMVALLAPTAIWKSLQFSSVYYIMLFSIFAMLLNPKELLTGNKVIYLFLLSGIATAYFDFLTYPTVSMTVPLVFLCVRESERTRSCARESLHLIMGCAFIWLIGYAGMWAGKWLLALVFGGESFLQTLVSQIQFRLSSTDHAENPISRFHTIKACFYECFSYNRWFMICVAYILCQTLSILTKSHKKSLRNLIYLFPLSVPICISLLWVLILANHTHIHRFFTYRTVVPVVFAVLVMFSPTVDSPRDVEIANFN